jgi:multiple sugar transport system permease protein
MATTLQNVATQRRPAAMRFGGRRLNQVLRILAILTVLALSLFPLYWMLATAVTPGNELLRYPPRFLPTDQDWTAFRDVLAGSSFLAWLGNSSLMTTASVVAALAVSTFAAYSLSRFRSGFSSVIAYVLLATRMIPGTVLLVPLYVIFREWGLLDTKVALIIAYTTFEIPFATWMLKGYFDSIPPELEQAAEVDGATPLGAFLRVSLPLTGPGIAASAIASAILAWSDYEFARGLLSSQSNWPLTIGIHSFIGEHVVHWNEIMASSLMATLPVVVIFLAAERFIVAGLTAGAVKS